MAPEARHSLLTKVFGQVLERDGYLALWAPSRDDHERLLFAYTLESNQCAEEHASNYTDPV